MPSSAYKHFARVCGLASGAAALRLFYTAYYFAGAIFLLMGVLWFIPTINSMRR